MVTLMDFFPAEIIIYESGDVTFENPDKPADKSLMSCSENYKNFHVN